VHVAVAQLRSRGRQQQQTVAETIEQQLATVAVQGGVEDGV
jgi:hypothetical protein